jgi:uncharacterized protein YbaA (DUF1428 family)
MALYVDGFVIPIKKKNLKAYRELARQAGKVWRDHGALEYRECVGDDFGAKSPASFPRRTGAKAGETVLFSWITYKSRAHRDRVNAKVMKDPRIAKMATEMQPGKHFDMKRMSHGGFKLLVEA